jgi:hypothetical protein
MLFDYSNRWSKNRKEQNPKVPLCPYPTQGMPIHPLDKSQGNTHQAKSSTGSQKQALRGVGLFLARIHR